MEGLNEPGLVWFLMWFEQQSGRHTDPCMCSARQLHHANCTALSAHNSENTNLKTDMRTFGIGCSHNRLFQ